MPLGFQAWCSFGSHAFINCMIYYLSVVHSMGNHLKGKKRWKAKEKEQQNVIFQQKLHTAQRWSRKGRKNAALINIYPQNIAEDTIIGTAFVIKYIKHMSNCLFPLITKTKLYEDRCQPPFHYLYPRHPSYHSTFLFQAAALKKNSPPRVAR